MSATKYQEQQPLHTGDGCLWVENHHFIVGEVVEVIDEVVDFGFKCLRMRYFPYSATSSATMVGSAAASWYSYALCLADDVAVMMSSPRTAAIFAMVAMVRL